MFVIPAWNMVVVRLGLDEWSGFTITDATYATFLGKVGHSLPEPSAGLGLAAGAVLLAALRSRRGRYKGARRVRLVILALAERWIRLRAERGVRPDDHRRQRRLAGDGLPRRQHLHAGRGAPWVFKRGDSGTPFEVVSLLGPGVSGLASEGVPSRLAALTDRPPHRPGHEPRALDRRVVRRRVRCGPTRTGTNPTITHVGLFRFESVAGSADEFLLTQTPEPGTAALLGLGLVALGAEASERGGARPPRRPASGSPPRRAGGTAARAGAAISWRAPDA